MDIDGLKDLIVKLTAENLKLKDEVEGLKITRDVWCDNYAKAIDKIKAMEEKTNGTSRS